MDMKLRIFALITVLALSACATKPASQSDAVYYVNGEQRTGDYYVDSSVQKARVNVSNAATATSNSLTQLAAMEKAEAPKRKSPQSIDGDAMGLGGLTSVNWTGPLEPLVLRLATAANYKFRAVGKNPTLPVLVTINRYNLPLADVLRLANLQAGQKADIVVYPKQRLIELRYR